MTPQINQTDSGGRRHGLWEYYHPDGSLWWRGHYLHGELHGVRELRGLWGDYYENGTLYYKKYYLIIK